MERTVRSYPRKRTITRPLKTWQDCGKKKKNWKNLWIFFVTRRNTRSLARESRRACSLSDLREPVRHCWQRRLQAKQKCRSLAFPVRISWKCLSAWALRVSGICLTTPRKMRRVSCLLMRLTRLPEDAEPEWAADMTNASRP